ncbi:MAG: glutamine--fructose-6-phosphate transaminase (isomerizing) [Deltaproteobacteria bacterium]|nr:MAG: glutamine--fructose-6-phosphate transaminase (isomerizing) [Deltaproteobacteria bacterium]
MCGIVGYIGSREATDVLIDGLRRLEYRGYDSAGAAVSYNNEIQIVRAEGKLKELESKITKNPLNGTLGIGHTRWATHGRPSETNAHPHRAGDIVLVHNGIIENHQKLRAYLSKKGHTFKSETDSEIAAQLIQQRMFDGLSMEKAFCKVLSEIEGSYALVVLNQKEPDRLYVARNGSPLVVGLGKNENFVASDIAALIAYTKNVIFLEDKDFGIVTRDGVKIFDGKGKQVKRPVKEVTWSRTTAEKGGYKHFMLKEIFEQPQVIADTLLGRVIQGKQGEKNQQKIILENMDALFGPKNKPIPFDKIFILACGTSYHSGLVGKYFIEEMSRLSIQVDLASEFRYRNPVIDKKTLVIGISQSGETADTLAAMTDAKKKGAKLLSICNVLESSIPRLSHATLYTRAGPEIGVASTKAFTTQLTVLLLLALYLGRRTKKMPTQDFEEALKELVRLPDRLEKMLKTFGNISQIADRHKNRSSYLYLARGANYPIALEGALKLKEISYIHAEGYAAGEMKHGPIALIDEGMPVVVVIPQDRVYEKVLSNIEEVRARGACVIALGNTGDKILQTKAQEVILVPKAPWYLTPILMSIPLQLLAYHIADKKGTDVDQPRNLAKSVTVE